MSGCCISMRPYLNGRALGFWAPSYPIWRFSVVHPAILGFFKGSWGAWKALVYLSSLPSKLLGWCLFAHSTARCLRGLVCTLVYPLIHVCGWYCFSSSISCNLVYTFSNSLYLIYITGACVAVWLANSQWCLGNAAVRERALTENCYHTLLPLWNL